MLSAGNIVNSFKIFRSFLVMRDTSISIVNDYSSQIKVHVIDFKPHLFFDILLSCIFVYILSVKPPNFVQIVSKKVPQVMAKILMKLKKIDGFNETGMTTLVKISILKIIL